MSVEEGIQAGPAQYVGARVLRVEDPRFLRGEGRYVDDVELPRMLHAAFVRSPYAHARILSVDLEQARAVPGVVGVWSGADLAAHVGPLVRLPYRPEMAETRQQPLPTDRVRHVGEAVAVVVASSRYIAEDAVQLVQIEWEQLPAVLDGEAAMAVDAPQLEEGVPNNNVAHIVFEAGEIDRVFAEADHVFSKRFYTHRYAAMPLEGRGVVAEWDRGTEQLTVWISNQFPHITRTAIAAPLGLDEQQISIATPAVGGGFGQKAGIFPEDLVIPALAKLVGRPVKWIEDRYENIAASSHSKELTADVELAVAADGRFLAIRGRFVGDGGAYSGYPFTTLVDPLCAAGMIYNHYAIEHARAELDGPLTNKCPTGAYRGVGWTPGHTAREVLIDEAARGLGLDPVQLRIDNCIPPGPYDAPFGQRFDGGSYAASLELARELVDYDAFRARQRALRSEGRYIGIGFSPYIEPSGFSSQMSKSNGFVSSYFDTASVTMEPNGTVTVTTGLHSHGQGHETSFAQVAADQLGVRVEDVRVVEGDTRTSSFGMGTYASRSAVIGTGTVTAAAREVRVKLTALAAERLEASADDIELRGGSAFVRGAPQVGVTIAELAASVYWMGAEAPDGVDDLALTATRSYDPGETYSNGTVAIAVEVDVETGIVELQRIVAIEDCGKMLNPMIVEGQVAGAVAQGIGGALYEEIVYGDDGQLLSASLMEYLYPSSMEVPAMELHHLETPSPVSEGGVKGMGEAGSIATPAAIVNAVADALSPFGVTIDRTPLGPSYVLDLLRQTNAHRDGSASNDPRVVGGR